MKFYSKFFATALTLASLSAYAQQDADMTNAILAMRNNDLPTAKSAIDKAVAKPKVNTKGKVWRYKAEIYDRCYTSGKPEVVALMGDSGAIAIMNSIKTVYQLDKPGTEHYDIVKRLEPNLKVHLNNEAVSFYNQKQFESAYKNFMAMTQMNPKDTNSYVNAITVGIQMPDYGKVKSALTSLKENLKVPADVYAIILRFLQKDDAMKAEYRTMLTAARADYPTEKEFALSELNIYLAEGKQGEARQKIDESIKLDPNNKILYFVSGNLYENESKKEKLPFKEVRRFQLLALEDYKKSAKIDPEYNDALYNIGVIYVTMANPTIDSLNNLPPKLAADANVVAKFNKRIDTYYREALPFFEKSYGIDNKNRNVVTILTKIYGRFKMQDKYKVMNARLDELDK